MSRRQVPPNPTSHRQATTAMDALDNNSKSIGRGTAPLRSDLQSILQASQQLEEMNRRLIKELAGAGAAGVDLRRASGADTTASHQLPSPSTPFVSPVLANNRVKKAEGGASSRSLGAPRWPNESAETYKGGSQGGRGTSIAGNTMVSYASNVSQRLNAERSSPLRQPPPNYLLPDSASRSKPNIYQPDREPSAMADSSQPLSALLHPYLTAQAEQHQPVAQQLGNKRADHVHRRVEAFTRLPDEEAFGNHFASGIYEGTSEDGWSAVAGKERRRSQQNHGATKAGDNDIMKASSSAYGQFTVQKSTSSQQQAGPVDSRSHSLNLKTGQPHPLAFLGGFAAEGDGRGSPDPLRDSLQPKGKQQSASRDREYRMPSSGEIPEQRADDSFEGRRSSGALGPSPITTQPLPGPPPPPVAGMATLDKRKSFGRKRIESPANKVKATSEPQSPQSTGSMAFLAGHDADSRQGSESLAEAAHRRKASQAKKPRVSREEAIRDLQLQFGGPEEVEEEELEEHYHSGFHPVRSHGKGSKADGVLSGFNNNDEDYFKRIQSDATANLSRTPSPAARPQGHAPTPTVGGKRPVVPPTRTKATKYSHKPNYEDRDPEVASVADSDDRYYNWEEARDEGRRAFGIEEEEEGDSASGGWGASMQRRYDAEERKKLQVQDRHKRTNEQRKTRQREIDGDTSTTSPAPMSRNSTSASARYSRFATDTAMSETGTAEASQRMVSHKPDNGEADGEGSPDPGLNSTAPFRGAALPTFKGSQSPPLPAQDKPFTAPHQHGTTPETTSTADLEFARYSTVASHQSADGDPLLATIRSSTEDSTPLSHLSKKASGRGKNIRFTPEVEEAAAHKDPLEGSLPKGSYSMSSSSPPSPPRPGPAASQPKPKLTSGQASRTSSTGAGYARPTVSSSNASRTTSITNRGRAGTSPPPPSTPPLAADDSAPKVDPYAALTTLTEMLGLRDQAAAELEREVKALMEEQEIANVASNNSEDILKERPENATAAPVGMLLGDPMDAPALPKTSDPRVVTYVVGGARKPKPEPLEAEPLPLGELSTPPEHNSNPSIPDGPARVGETAPITLLSSDGKQRSSVTQGKVASAVAELFSQSKESTLGSTTQEASSVPLLRDGPTTTTVVPRKRPPLPPQQPSTLPPTPREAEQPKSSPEAGVKLRTVSITKDVPAMREEQSPATGTNIPTESNERPTKDPHSVQPVPNDAHNRLDPQSTKVEGMNKSYPSQETIDSSNKQPFEVAKGPSLLDFAAEADEDDGLPIIPKHRRNTEPSVSETPSHQGEEFCGRLHSDEDTAMHFVAVASSSGNEEHYSCLGGHTPQPAKEVPQAGTAGADPAPMLKAGPVTATMQQPELIERSISQPTPPTSLESPNATTGTSAPTPRASAIVTLAPRGNFSSLLASLPVTQNTNAHPAPSTAPSSLDREQSNDSPSISASAAMHSFAEDCSLSYTGAGPVLMSPNSRTRGSYRVEGLSGTTIGREEMASLEAGPSSHFSNPNMSNDWPTTMSAALRRSSIGEGQPADMDGQPPILDFGKSLAVAPPRRPSFLTDKDNNADDDGRQLLLANTAKPQTEKQANPEIDRPRFNCRDLTATETFASTAKEFEPSKAKLSIDQTNDSCRAALEERFASLTAMRDRMSKGDKIVGPHIKSGRRGSDSNLLTQSSSFTHFSGGFGSQYMSDQQHGGNYYLQRRNSASLSEIGEHENNNIESAPIAIHDDEARPSYTRPGFTMKMIESIEESDIGQQSIENLRSIPTNMHLVQHGADTPPVQVSAPTTLGSLSEEEENVRRAEALVRQIEARRNGGLPMAQEASFAPSVPQLVSSRTFPANQTALDSDEDMVDGGDALDDEIGEDISMVGSTAKYHQPSKLPAESNRILGGRAGLVHNATPQDGRRPTHDPKYFGNKSFINNSQPSYGGDIDDAEFGDGEGFEDDDNLPAVSTTKVPLSTRKSKVDLTEERIQNLRQRQLKQFQEQFAVGNKTPPSSRGAAPKIVQLANAEQISPEMFKPSMWHTARGGPEKSMDDPDYDPLVDNPFLASHPVIQGTVVGRTNTGGQQAGGYPYDPSLAPSTLLDKLYERNYATHESKAAPSTNRGSFGPNERQWTEEQEDEGASVLNQMRKMRDRQHYSQGQEGEVIVPVSEADSGEDDGEAGGSHWLEEEGDTENPAALSHQVPGYAASKPDRSRRSISVHSKEEEERSPYAWRYRVDGGKVSRGTTRGEDDGLVDDLSSHQRWQYAVGADNLPYQVATFKASAASHRATVRPNVSAPQLTLQNEVTAETSEVAASTKAAIITTSPRHRFVTPSPLSTGSTLSEMAWVLGMPVNELMRHNQALASKHGADGRLPPTCQVRVPVSNELPTEVIVVANTTPKRRVMAPVEIKSQAAPPIRGPLRAPSLSAATVATKPLSTSLAKQEVGHGHVSIRNGDMHIHPKELANVASKPSRATSPAPAAPQPAAANAHVLAITPNTKATAQPTLRALVIGPDSEFFKPESTRKPALVSQPPVIAKQTSVAASMAKLSVPTITHEVADCSKMSTVTSLAPSRAVTPKADNYTASPLEKQAPLHTDRPKTLTVIGSTNPITGHKADGKTMIPWPTSGKVALVIEGPLNHLIVSESTSLPAEKKKSAAPKQLISPNQPAAPTVLSTSTYSEADDDGFELPVHLLKAANRRLDKVQPTIVKPPAQPGALAHRGLLYITTPTSSTTRLSLTTATTANVPSRAIPMTIEEIAQCYNLHPDAVYDANEEALVYGRLEHGLYKRGSSSYHFQEPLPGGLVLRIPAN